MRPARRPKNGPTRIAEFEPERPRRVGCGLRLFVHFPAQRPFGLVEMLTRLGRRIPHALGGRVQFLQQRDGQLIDQTRRIGASILQDNLLCGRTRRLQTNTQINNARLNPIRVHRNFIDQMAAGPERFGALREIFLERQVGKFSVFENEDIRFETQTQQQQRCQFAIECFGSSGVAWADRRFKTESFTARSGGRIVFGISGPNSRSIVALQADDHGARLA